MRTKEEILISLLPTQYNESTLEQVFTPIKLKAFLSAMEEYASQSKLEAHFYYGWMLHILAPDRNRKLLLTKQEQTAFDAGYNACANRWDDFDKGHMTFYNSALEIWKEDL